MTMLTYIAFGLKTYNVLGDTEKIKNFNILLAVLINNFVRLLTSIPVEFELGIIYMYYDGHYHINKQENLRKF